MIKVERTKRGCEVTIEKVNGPNLLAEFVAITEGIFETLVNKCKVPEEGAKEMLQDAFECAFLTEEEMEAKVKKQMDEMVENGDIGAVLMGLLKTMERAIEKDREEARKELGK